MSWIMSGVNGEEPEKYVEPADSPKVPDPSIPNRMVADKAANKPFLAWVQSRVLHIPFYLTLPRYKAYRDNKEKQHNEWLERVKIRNEKIARGEKVGPEEKDPTEPEEVGCLGLLKFFIYLMWDMFLCFCLQAESALPPVHSPLWRVNISRGAIHGITKPD